MEKLQFIMREPRMWDYNRLVNAINELIDFTQRKVSFQDLQITKFVKDYDFFKWEKVKFPYHKSYTITSQEELSNVLNTYNFDRDEASGMVALVNDWVFINLTIHIEEVFDEKEEKQAIMIEKIESTPIKEVKKKTTKKTTRKKTK